ncbi:MAG: hypothetical protein NT169_22240 [Chloroflexi bacterium]|nr:hypothetical protein [Chloroflexota bacterium]
MVENRALKIRDEDDEALARLRELAAKAKQTDGADAEVRALQVHLEAHPGLWRHVGDLVVYAEDRLIAVLGKTPLMAESMRRGQAELRAELGYETAPALERLLIEQVVLYHLRWSLAEFEFNAVMGDGKASEQAVRFMEERAGVAQHSYLRACETLARIRKLAQRTPALVQLNIGAAQTNVVALRGDAATDASG